MKIHTWQVKDILFNDNEKEKAQYHIERLKESGWWIREEEGGEYAGYDWAIQLHKDWVNMPK